MLNDPSSVPRLRSNIRRKHIESTRAYDRHQPMGDLIIALSCIAYVFVLYHRIQQGRAMKRLLKLLEEQKKAEEK